MLACDAFVWWGARCGDTISCAPRPPPLTCPSPCLSPPLPPPPNSPMTVNSVMAQLSVLNSRFMNGRKQGSPGRRADSSWAWNCGTENGEGGGRVQAAKEPEG